MVASRWSRWITTAAVLLLALIAAVVSYSHMYELALHHGEPAWRAALFPVSADGMVVAASMALLNDARQGRRGGLLPWSLLIIGSLASLAADIAVADPSAWSRIIHAWPSFALIGSYELLMRQFQANSSCTRSAYADRGRPGERRPYSRLGPGLRADWRRRGATRVAGGTGTESVIDGRGCGVRRNGGLSAPDSVQCLGVGPGPRRKDGSLPSGQELAEQFGWKPCWGRLVKQRGEQGQLDTAA